MKEGTENKLKFKKLKRRLSMPEWQVIGLLEAIWKLTRSSAPEGDIGRFSNEDIAAGIEYDGDADELVNHLVETCWLDEDEEFRLIVHDWSDHVPTYMKGQMKRYKKQFADRAAKERHHAVSEPCNEPQFEPPDTSTEITKAPNEPCSDPATKPIPNQTNPPPPKPPQPEPANEPSPDRTTTTTDLVFDFETELVARGVRNPRPIAEAFYGRGFMDHQAKLILDHWDQNPNAWETGALVWRLKNLRGEWLPSEGWPPKSQESPEPLGRKSGPPAFDDWCRRYLTWCKSQGKEIPSDAQCREAYDRKYSEKVSA